ncbi:MAG: 50S ribosomal protein L30 [Candidatus Izimaplasma sp.]|nr:50S ribosomal protein L30 [Candidatus Izimaplasma bacterium]
MKQLNITLKKSLNGRNQKQRNTAKALGLTKLRKTVTKNDTPTIRGMIRRISHLVEVSEK